MFVISLYWIVILNLHFVVFYRIDEKNMNTIKKDRSQERNTTTAPGRTTVTIETDC